MKLGNTGRLTIIWAALGILILVNSYFFPAGYLNPDSTRYLQLAGNLLEGQGFLVPDYTYHEGLTWFSIWPVGYPVAITLIAWIFHLPVFWASKVLNILIIGLTFILLTKWFRQQAWFIALVFFIDTLITVYTMTWSEGLFLLLLIWYCYSMWNYIHFYENKRYLVYLFISSLLLFLTRYIGGIFIAPLGILSFYFFRKKHSKQATFLLISATILVLIETGYLYLNYVKTGYVSGTQTVHVAIRLKEYFLMLGYGLIKELVPVQIYSLLHQSSTRIVLINLILLGIIIIAGIVIKKKYFPENQWRLKSREIVLGVIGAYYILLICITRIVVTFEPGNSFNFRILSPATFLLSVVILSVLSQSRKLQKAFTRFYWIALVFTLIYYAPPIKMWVYSGFKPWPNFLELYPTHSQYEQSVKEYYKDLPENSIVIFGSEFINYIFKDKFIAEPKTMPGEMKETLDQVQKRIKSIKSVKHAYIEIHDNLKPNRYHPSIYQFMEEHKGEKFYRIK